MHGWPGISGRDLEKLAFLAARKGEPGKYGWPIADNIDYVPLQYGRPALSRHPHDDGVWLAAATAPDELPEDVHAVVSLCLTGAKQMPAHIGADTVQRGPLRRDELPTGRRPQRSLPRWPHRSARPEP